MRRFEHWQRGLNPSSPPSQRRLPTKQDDDLEAGEQSDQLAERVTRLVHVSDAHRADAGSIANVPTDHVPRHDIARPLDPGVPQQLPHVGGRLVSIVGADDATPRACWTRSTWAGRPGSRGLQQEKDPRVDACLGGVEPRHCLASSVLHPESLHELGQRRNVGLTEARQFPFNGLLETMRSRRHGAVQIVPMNRNAQSDHRSCSQWSPTVSVIRHRRILYASVQDRQLRRRLRRSRPIALSASANSAQLPSPHRPHRPLAA